MKLPATIDALDVQITSWMARHGIAYTRVALGVVFFWFGVIKFVPGWSPAADLATRTIALLTFGSVSPAVALNVLAAWETLIGLGLMAGVFLRFTLLLLFLQMPGTLLPLLFFPDETFVAFPHSPTLEGQYIIKNLVLVCAAIVVGATVRGGRLSARSAAESSATPSGGSQS
jgi:uncharacterized membrane protein YkgB